MKNRMATSASNIQHQTSHQHHQNQPLQLQQLTQMQHQQQRQQTMGSFQQQHQQQGLGPHCQLPLIDQQQQQQQQHHEQHHGQQQQHNLNHPQQLIEQAQQVTTNSNTSSGAQQSASMQHPSHQHHPSNHQPQQQIIQQQQQQHLHQQQQQSLAAMQHSNGIVQRQHQPPVPSQVARTTNNHQHPSIQGRPSAAASGGGGGGGASNNYIKKELPANGKKTKGRVRIKMEFIHNKLRRYTTFSKRKTGIMKKAFELATLTGTQVMLLVASETGHVYTFATRKLQPMIISDAGKALIQTCLNSPDQQDTGLSSSMPASASSAAATSGSHQQPVHSSTSSSNSNSSPPSHRHPSQLTQSTSSSLSACSTASSVSSNVATTSTAASGDKQQASTASGSPGHQQASPGSNSGLSPLSFGGGGGGPCVQLIQQHLGTSSGLHGQQSMGIQSQQNMMLAAQHRQQQSQANTTTATTAPTNTSDQRMSATGFEETDLSYSISGDLDDKNPYNQCLPISMGTMATAAGNANGSGLLGAGSHQLQNHQPHHGHHSTVQLVTNSQAFEQTLQSQDSLLIPSGSSSAHNTNRRSQQRSTASKNVASSFFSSPTQQQQQQQQPTHFNYNPLYNGLGSSTGASSDTTTNYLGDDFMGQLDQFEQNLADVDDEEEEEEEDEDDEGEEMDELGGDVEDETDLVLNEMIYHFYDNNNNNNGNNNNDNQARRQQHKSHQQQVAINAFGQQLASEVGSFGSQQSTQGNVNQRHLARQPSSGAPSHKQMRRSRGNASHSLGGGFITTEDTDLDCASGGLFVEYQQTSRNSQNALGSDSGGPGRHLELEELHSLNVTNCDSETLEEQINLLVSSDPDEMGVAFGSGAATSSTSQDEHYHQHHQVHHHPQQDQFSLNGTGGAPDASSDPFMSMFFDEHDHQEDQSDDIFRTQNDQVLSQPPQPQPHLTGIAPDQRQDTRGKLQRNTGSKRKSDKLAGSKATPKQATTAGPGGVAINKNVTTPSNQQTKTTKARNQQGKTQTSLTTMKENHHRVQQEKEQQPAQQTIPMRNTNKQLLPKRSGTSSSSVANRNTTQANKSSNSTNTSRPVSDCQLPTFEQLDETPYRRQLDNLRKKLRMDQSSLPVSSHNNSNSNIGAKTNSGYLKAPVVPPPTPTMNNQNQQVISISSLPQTQQQQPVMPSGANQAGTIYLRTPSGGLIPVVSSAAAAVTGSTATIESQHGASLVFQPPRPPTTTNDMIDNRASFLLSEPVDADAESQCLLIDEQVLEEQPINRGNSSSKSNPQRSFHCQLISDQSNRSRPSGVQMSK